MKRALIAAIMALPLGVVFLLPKPASAANIILQIGPGRSRPTVYQRGIVQPRPTNRAPAVYPGARRPAAGIQKQQQQRVWTQRRWVPGRWEMVRGNRRWVEGYWIPARHEYRW